MSNIQKLTLILKQAATQS